MAGEPSEGAGATIKTMSKALAIALVGTVLLGGCARTVSHPKLTPASHRSHTKFDSVWIAGFVVERNDGLDVGINDQAVDLFRSRLKNDGTVRVIDEPALSVSSERDVLTSTRYRRVVDSYGSPLIVTGSLRFDHTPDIQSRSLRRAGWPGRVSLSGHLMLIDGRTGGIVSECDLPAEILNVRRPPRELHALVDELLSPLTTTGVTHLLSRR